MDKQINHDNHHDESKTRTHRFSKLPDDGDPWATDYIRSKRKTPVEPRWSMQQTRSSGPNQLKRIALIQSDARPTGVQLKKAAQPSTTTGPKTKHADCRMTSKPHHIRLILFVLYFLLFYTMHNSHYCSISKNNGLSCIPRSQYPH